jgi:small subunit ribosomal protein S1
VHEADGRQHHVLRRVLQARGGRRGPGAHLRDVLDQAHQSPQRDRRADQKVKVKVLEINKDKQEISLGMKQVEENPWERVAEKYPPGSVVEGKVRNIANYGAFVEIEEGIDGLLHVSDLSWTKKIGHPSRVLKKGEDVRPSSSASIRRSSGSRWAQADAGRPVDDRSSPPTTAGHGGQGPRHEDRQLRRVRGARTGLEGLLHISEISDQKIEKPEDQLKVGQELDVKILRVDSEERKIGLSLKRAQWAQEEEKREEQRAQRAEKRGLRGGLEGGEQSAGLGDLKLGRE